MLQFHQEIWTVRRSVDAIITALRSWAAFCRSFPIPVAPEIPAREETIRMWLTVIFNPSTGASHFFALRRAHQIVGAHLEAFTGPVEKFVKDKKKEYKTLQPDKPSLSRTEVVRLVSPAICPDPLIRVVIALAFTFLLRVPSEALPMRRCQLRWDDAPAQPATLRAHEVHSSIGLYDGALWLTLAHRKWKPQGVLMRRPCICPALKQLCPVHVIAPFIAGVAHGEPLFRFTTAQFDYAIKQLTIKIGRRFTMESKILRRSAAAIIQSSGFSPEECKIAGQWSPNALYDYLDKSLDCTWIMFF